MVDRGPGGSDDREERPTHPPPLVLFDEDEQAGGRSGPVAWLRHHPTPFVVVLVGAAAWWGYRTFAHTRASRWEEMTPVQLEEPTPDTSPSDGPAYRVGVTPLSDSLFSAPLGSSVVLTTRAMGPGGSPLADQIVRFRITEGSGRLAQDTVRTDSMGLARTSLVLPPQPGHLVVTAELAGTTLPRATFSVTARPGAPRHAAISGGNAQEAAPGTVLPDSLAVLVTDADGAPVPGVEVRFHVVGAEGAVAPSRVRTDSTGYASTVWRLGGTPGAQHVAALVPAIDDALLTFDATAVSASAEPPPTPDEHVPASVTVTARPFAVGGNFVCSIVGGRMSCRGGDDRGQRLQGSSRGFVAVFAGVSHACALTREGQASCWGANDSGQLGDGSRIDRTTPTTVVTDVRFSVLSAGVSHTCGLSVDDRVLCWGADLGSAGGSGDDHLTPAPVPGNRRFVQIVAGWNHMCGLTEAKKAYCWGNNDHGQLGDGTHLDRTTPTEVPGTFESLAAGNAHTCGIEGGEVFCWGDNRSGQLGDGSTQSHSSPDSVHGLPASAARVASGAVSTCALLTDGRVYCWGQNVHGELGDGTRSNRTRPVAVSGDLTFRSIHAGGALTCGFADGGTEYCWGLNQSGQLGDGTRESRSVPTAVGG